MNRYDFEAFVDCRPLNLHGGQNIIEASNWHTAFYRMAKQIKGYYKGKKIDKITIRGFRIQSNI